MAGEVAPGLVEGSEVAAPAAVAAREEAGWAARDLAAAMAAVVQEAKDLAVDLAVVATVAEEVEAVTAD